jgi:endoglycosylceramidase
MWTDGYLSQAIGVAFQYLYDNYGGSMDSMAQFWAKVASLFKESPNVLGYELINEPWAGDIYSIPPLLAPGNAGARNLAPAYNKINAAIRQIDNKTLLFYEPVTWGVFLNGEHAGTGFDAVPGGAIYKNVSVLAYHYYCWLMDMSHQHHPFSFLQRTICDKITGPQVFPAVLNDIHQTGGSSFLTEFGACEPDGKANSSATVECDFVMKTADEFLASWTYWDDVFFDTKGHVNWNVTRPFARVYARAISGTPLVMNFSLTDFNFYFKFQLDSTITQSTEIVVPKLHYPNGFKVLLTKGMSWTFDTSERILKVFVKKVHDVNLTNPVVEVRIMPTKKRNSP